MRREMNAVVVFKDRLDPSDFAACDRLTRTETQLVRMLSSSIVGVIDWFQFGTVSTEYASVCRAADAYCRPHESDPQGRLL